jgi:hypothetical protein
MVPVLLGFATPALLFRVAVAAAVAADSCRHSPPPLPTVDPRWRTADVMALAAGIVEDRAFDRLPILGDALMDAGCEDSAIIQHCQQGGADDQESWVVDLILASR